MSLDGPSGEVTLADRGISGVEVEAVDLKQSVEVAGELRDVDLVVDPPADISE